MPGPCSAVLLAQNANPAPAQPGMPMWFLVLNVMMIYVLWVVIMRNPQKRIEQQKRAMLEAMKKNDRVVTTGGIFGTVVSVDPEAKKVVVRIDDEKGVKITISKDSIAQVIDPAKDKDAKEKVAGVA